MKKLIALAAVVALAAGGCTSDTEDPKQGDGGGAGPGPAGVLRVLAGSELQDLEPMLEEIRRATGVQMKFTYTGTLDGVERVYTGAAARDTDAIWFSSNRYLELHGDAVNRISTQTKVMSSPVILGVRSAQAAELGWDKRRPTWKEIA
jgi:Ca-activated chloride channel family protein